MQPKKKSTKHTSAMKPKAQKKHAQGLPVGTTSIRAGQTCCSVIGVNGF